VRRVSASEVTTIWRYTNVYIIIIIIIMVNGCVQEAVRTLLKQLVACALVPSPIRRSVSLAELERGHTMLHWMMVMMNAEEAVDIKPVRGDTLLLSQLFSLLLDRLLRVDPIKWVSYVRPSVRPSVHKKFLRFP